MSSFGPPPLPPAGWYPDPERPGRSRWWDGRAWAAPADASPPDSYPEVGDLLGRAFARALRHWRSTAIVALVTTAPSAVLVSVTIRMLLSDVVVLDDEVIGWTNDRILPAAIMFVVASALGLFGYLAIVWLMIAAVDLDAGADPRHGGAARTTSAELGLARAALVHAVRATLRAIGWSLLITVVVMLAMGVGVGLLFVAWPLGVLVFLALVPLGIWLGVRYAFVVQAIVDGRGNPLRRSAVVVAGRWWPTFGRLLLVGIVAGVIGSMMNSATSLANGTGVFAGFGETAGIEISDDGSFERFELDAVAPSTLGIVVGAVAAIAVAVFSTGVNGAAAADMYRTRQAATGPPSVG